MLDILTLIQGRNLRPCSVASACLLRGKLEDKVRRKTLFIALHLLVKSLRRDAVDGGQIRIQNDRDIADMADGNFHGDGAISLQCSRKPSSSPPQGLRR